MEQSFIESILYYLSQSDPTKIKEFHKTKLKHIYSYYYLNRIKDLNELLDQIAYLRHIKELEKK